MPRPSGGSVAESEHLITIDAALQRQLTVQLQHLKTLSASIGQAANLMRKAGHPALAAKLITANSKAAGDARKTLANMDKNMQKAAAAAEVTARKTLEDGRAQNGRDEQPTGFLDKKGGVSGHRERMRDNITVGFESGGAYPLALNVGMLSDLKRVKDSQGSEVYQAIEYGWDTGPRASKGVFVSFGGPVTQVGDSSGQAVFVPTKGGRKMKPNNMFPGYHFLAAGKKQAAAAVASAQAKAVRDITKLNTSLTAELQRVNKDLALANARQRNKQRRQGNKPGRP